MSSFRCFFEILFALLNIATLPFVGTCLAEINIAIVTPRQSKANGETLLLYGNQGLVSALLAIETVNNKSDTACDYLKLGDSLQQMLRIIPYYSSKIRIGRNTRSASSIIMSELLSIISIDYLNTNVDIVDSTNYLQSMESLKDDKVDLSSEIMLTPDDAALGNDYAFDYFMPGYESKLGIYLHIPEKIRISDRSVSHYLYSDVLRPYLPPLGTNVIKEGRYLVAFLSCDICELSRTHLRGLKRLSLPSATSCSYKDSIPTTYSYDSKKLGGYTCDFPIKKSYIFARKTLRTQFPAISTLIERVKLSTEDLEQILNYHSDLSLGVKHWLSSNNETWSKWMIGCNYIAVYLRSKIHDVDKAINALFTKFHS
eukprot:g9269.t1